MKVLLVWPKTPDTFWSFNHVLPFISRKAAHPPLGILTAAAFLPRDWEIRLVDMNVRRMNDADIAWADYVMISAMIVHVESAKEVIARCIAQKRAVIAGGPLFTTGHERFPEIDHFVLGEAEELMADLVADMRAGTVKKYYLASRKPDVSRTPPPRWDIIRMKDYATMAVQFSRGCPFNCEFCDIIVMNGRVPRVKTPEQMVAEFDSLVAAGWDGPVFVVDDNFIGHKVKAKSLLRAIIAWRQKHRMKITFLTEASLNVADDGELLELLAQAGFKKLFIGIESPSEESLGECSKVQNTGRDLVADVKKIQAAGLEVMGGFIVGFDSDKESIFERQWRFIQEAGVVTAMVGLLTALPETQLFKRLQKEGRLLGHSTGNNLDAVLNFVPKLDRETLLNGYRDLVRRLYMPREYYHRILTFLRQYKPTGPKTPITALDIRAFLHSLWAMGVVGSGRFAFWRFVTRAFFFHRRAFAEAMGMAILGHHFRRVARSI